VLVVFNHPMWDLYLIGKEKHSSWSTSFCRRTAPILHALELNGLRNWDENRAVRRLAEKWNMLLISGGDRHGVEPNANINLTNAASSPSSCTRSGAKKEQRALHAAVCRAVEASHSAVDHRCRAPLSRVSAGLAHLGRARLPSRRERRGAAAERACGPAGKAPRAMRWTIGMVQLMGRGLVSGGLRMAWSESHQLRLALGEHDG
jgi:hypothetical protein